MNNRELIVKNHQIMSFNKIFAKMQLGQELFWPGCAILSLGSEITEKTYNLLKTKIPELSYSTFCCGKPSSHIYNGKDFKKRMDFIKKNLKENGTKKIYTLCPNCYVTLSEFSGIQVQSAWSLIDECLPNEKYNMLKGVKMSLHDPCPIVKDLESADSVRSILNKMGVEILEFKNNRNKTICCGKKDMLMAIYPEKGKKLFDIRASQAPSKDIVTYCASCVDTFRDNSFNANHILELLWQTEAKSSWLNRYKTVKVIKRSANHA
jgi:Fe-S oxidoreductase